MLLEVFLFLKNTDRNDDHDSGDADSDSDADETSSVRAFDIKSNASSSMSWHAGLVMDDDGYHGRRNAIGTEPNQKKAASKSKS